MTQRLSKGIQHKLLLKLLEFDYQIEYKKERENVVADALSRREPQIAAISSTSPAWVTGIEASYTDDAHCTDVIQKLQINPSAVPHYSIHSGILR
jgi:hypothetical protein